jgi:hypothetical protein
VALSPIRAGQTLWQSVSVGLIIQSKQLELPDKRLNETRSPKIIYAGLSIPAGQSDYFSQTGSGARPDFGL